MRVEAATMIRAPQQIVSAVYADYVGWPCLFPTTNGVRLAGGGGPKHLLEVDHAEGKVLNELVRRSSGQIDLRKAKRRYTAWFVNRFEVIPGGTRFSLSGEIALKGIARLVQPFLRGYVRRQLDRWVLEPVRAEAEKRAGVPAMASVSPGEPAGRRIRVAAIAAYGAAVLAFAYAAVSLYWTAGGTALLATVGGTMEEVANHGGLPAIALGSAASVLKAAGGMLALALIRPGGRIIPRKWLLRVAGVASAALSCYGAIQVAAGALVLSGAVDPSGPVDRTALRWHVALWDMWFLVWGLLLAIAVVAGWRAGRESR